MQSKKLRKDKTMFAIRKPKIKYDTCIRVIAGIFSGVFWGISVYFSSQGFDIAVPHFMWIGYVLGFGVTVLELVGNRGYTMRHPIIAISFSWRTSTEYGQTLPELPVYPLAQISSTTLLVLCWRLFQNHCYCLRSWERTLLNGLGLIRLFQRHKIKRSDSITGHRQRN